jgi:hypothetical protein
MSAEPQNFVMPENATSPERSDWRAVRSALVADVLRSNRHLQVRLLLRGESMLPTLWPGDVVAIESCSIDDARRGEIVLALRDSRFVLHRLIDPCTAKGFLLRGDSMPDLDPLFPPEALVGRLVRRNSLLGRTRFATNWCGMAWSRAWGTLFCHWGFARRIALRLHGWKSSEREFRNPELGAELSSSELGVS